MIVSADKEMRFYDSKNLKDWNYMSSFGEGYGAQPCQFECPDMVELPVDGDLNRKKWALIVNVNPGCYFGGSAWIGAKITMLPFVSQTLENERLLFLG